MTRLALLALVIALLAPSAALRAEEEKIHRRSMDGLPDIGQAAHAKMEELIGTYEKAMSGPLRKVWEEETVGDGSVPWSVVIDALEPQTKNLRGQALVEYRKFLKRKGRLEGWDHKLPPAWEEWLEHHWEFLKTVSFEGMLMIHQKQFMNNKTAEMKALMRLDARRIEGFRAACKKTNEDIELAKIALDQYQKFDQHDQFKDKLVTRYQTLKRDFHWFGNWVEIGMEMDERLKTLFSGTTRSGLVQKNFHEGFKTLEELTAGFGRVDPFFDWEIANWKESGEKHLKDYQDTIAQYEKETKSFRYLEFTRDLPHIYNNWEIILRPLISLKVELEELLK